VLNIRLPKPARRPILFGVPTLLKRLLREEDGAINVNLSRAFPGFGVGVSSSQYTSLAQALVGTTTLVLPTTGVFTLGTTCGRVRIKIYAPGGTSPTVSSIVFTATDGTNTVAFGAYNPPTAVSLLTTSWLDMINDYILDTAASGSGGGATGQLLPGGATKFSFIVTMGGTSPTASADLEIVPLI
jgi:hypothetical protein